MSDFVSLLKYVLPNKCINDESSIMKGYSIFFFFKQTTQGANAIPVKNVYLRDLPSGLEVHGHSEGVWAKKWRRYRIKRRRSSFPMRPVPSAYLFLIPNHTQSLVLNQECSPFMCNANRIVGQAAFTVLGDRTWPHRSEGVGGGGAGGCALHSQWSEAEGTPRSILRTGSPGWGSPTPGHHRLCHHREQILSRRRISGMVLASRHLCPRRTGRDGSILHQ